MLDTKIINFLTFKDIHFIDVNVGLNAVCFTSRIFHQLHTLTHYQILWRHCLIKDIAELIKFFFGETHISVGSNHPGLAPPPPPLSR